MGARKVENDISANTTDRDFISLREEATFLTIKIGDNGIGIGRDAINDVKAIGLLGMKERALAIDAQFSIEGGPGMGTIVSVQVPLSVQ